MLRLADARHIGWLLAGLLLAALPAAAHADSLVYVNSGAVWISHSDGSAAREVVATANNWTWPSRGRRRHDLRRRRPGAGERGRVGLRRQQRDLPLRSERQADGAVRGDAGQPLDTLLPHRRAHEPARIAERAAGLLRRRLLRQPRLVLGGPVERPLHAHLERLQQLGLARRRPHPHHAQRPHLRQRRLRELRRGHRRRPRPQ